MKADTKQLIAELHARLQGRLDEFTSSDEWLGWLRGARQFHRYSPGNQLLLMLQGAHGHVASYRTWQRIPAVDSRHCQVRRGEHGLTILAPLRITRHDVDEATGDEIAVGTVSGFRTVTVFHQGQLVAPPAIPERPMPAVLTGPDRWQHVWEAVVAQLGDHGFPVELHTAADGETWNGRTHLGEGYVEVMAHLEAPQRVKTLLHEWAHIELGHGDAELTALRPLWEVEAESVAYLLCQTIGLDSAEYSIPYLAAWSGGEPQLMQTTAQRILTSTASMVDALESKLTIDLGPDLFGAANDAPTPLHPAGQPAPTPAHPSIGLATPAAQPTGPDPVLEETPLGLRDLLARLDPSDRPALVNAVRRLDDPDGRGVALALCADAGLDAGRSAAVLVAAGADPVTLRRSMKAALIDVDGRRRPIFDDIDAAYRVGSLPSGFDQTEAELLHGVDVDDPNQVTAVVGQLHRQHQLGDLTVALTHLGVTRADAETALAAHGVDAAAEHRAPEPTQRTPVSTRIVEHEMLLRRVVDEAREPAQLAALTTGLGMTHAETVSACARLGLDPAITAQVALARRSGDATRAIVDLEEGWTAPPPTDGWAHHLPAVTQPAATGDIPPSEAAARAIVAQWRNASNSSPPTPALT